MFVKPRPHPRPSQGGLCLVRGCALLACAALAACGGPGTQGTEPTLVVTDEDPPPYTPQPEDRPQTGRVTAARLSGNTDQARRVALSLFEAVRAANMADLAELLAPRIASTQVPNFQRSMPREIIIAQIMRAHQRSTAPRPPADEMLNLQGIDVRPVRTNPGSAPGGGILGTDLLVTIPQTADGRREVPRWYTGWRSAVRIVVRPGSRALVVGM